MSKHEIPARLPVAAFLLLALSWSALNSGCGDDSATAPDATILDAEALDSRLDASQDADQDDAGQQDAGVVHPPCNTALVTDSPIDLDPAGPDTQIHAAAAFDGHALWLVYNRPDDQGLFDVYGLRLDCDGTLRTEPFRINTTDYNDIDPSIAIGPAGVLVSWQTDRGAAENNMQMLLRTFDLDASPLMNQDAMVRTDYQGQPVPGNTWMPVVAALPTGFALAGARALPDATGFQVFVQRIDAAGLSIESTMDASPAPLAAQTYPALATNQDGTIWLAFQQAFGPDYEDQVVSTLFAPGQTSPDILPPVSPDGRRQGQAPTLAVLSDGTPILAFADPNSRMVVVTLAAEADALQTEIGANARIDFAPVLAAGPDRTGAVAWYRNQSGIQNEFWVAGFSYDGSTFQVGSPILVTPEPVPPYQPAITHVTQDVYFLAWSQGSSPAFRITGIFLQVPAP